MNSDANITGRPFND